MAVQTTIKLRRDTAANWTSTNPTLAAGERGMETDTLKYKDGDGSTAWTSLPYEGQGQGIFGDGSDSSATISGSTTLTRDMFYTTLTVRNGGNLNSGGFRIFCSVLCQIDSGGKISNSGGDGAAGGTAGTAPGGPGAATTLGGNATTSAGAGGTTNGNAANTRSNALGGSGGTGGNGASGSGGAAGGATPPAAGVGTLRAVPFAIMGSVVSNQNTISSIFGGMGGGGGAGDGTAGGGGGGAGGAIMIAARNLILNGTVEAKGGNGGTPGAGNRGGGGGGGGGVITLVYNTKTGSGSTSVAGGTKGSKSGTGTDGTNGSAGNVIEVVNA